MSCTKLMNDTQVRTIKVISKGRIISDPDIFITYINLTDISPNDEIDCKTSQDSVIREVESLLKDHGISNYRIEKSKIQQHNAFRVNPDHANTLIGSYCESAIALTLFNEDESDRIYPDLLKKFEVSTLAYSSTKIDSLNLAAYDIALKNAKLLASRYLDSMNGKALKIVSISNFEEKGQRVDSYEVHKDSPSWIFSERPLKAIDMLQSSVIETEKILKVEFEIE